jgi:mannitol-1-phosphate 5-dehydrogenase
MKKLLIVGAGAVGRAFIPWVFPPEQFLYWYIDVNQYVINRLKHPGGTTYMTKSGGYALQRIKCQDTPPVEFDAVITAVGPRNFMNLVEMFKDTQTPIICCENDSRLPAKMSALTGNQNIYFAIPDVIASNMAPKRLTDIDPVAIVTEDGVCYIEYPMRDLGGNAVYLDKAGMYREWKAKLYIHNTPHCIAAYLGYQKRCFLLSDAMENIEIREIVCGAMAEMVNMVNIMYGIDYKFAEGYAEKEVARFCNKLLHDPISRVAREPLRKLAKDERLIGAAALCLQAGIEPTNIMKGIRAAMKYIHPKDPDYKTMKLVGDVGKFLDMIGVGPEEPIYNLMVKEIKL